MLISSVKFLAGPPIVYYGQLDDFTFGEANLFCITGGASGVIFFMMLSQQVNRIILHTKNSNMPVKSKSSKRKRQFIKFRNTFGLAGLAFVTPVFLSIPIGTFIAVKFYHNKKKIFLFMLCSIILWSLIITTFLELFEEIPFDRINTNDKI